MTQNLLLRLVVVALTGVLTSCNQSGQEGGPTRKAAAGNPTAAGQPQPITAQNSPKPAASGRLLLDKAGNIWFGTFNAGLYKYDGQSFTRFTTANGLSSNSVLSLLEDREGNIWIGTGAGLCRYDGKTIRPVHIPLPKNRRPNQYRSTHNVFSILQDQKGRLWFATVDGVYVYDGHAFTPFIFQESGGGYMSSNPNVEYILEDRAGTIWMGGRGNQGIFRYDGKTITTLQVNEQQEFNWAWPQVQDRQGNLWFSNWTGAYRYDGKSFAKVDGLYAGPVNPITRIIEDSKGTIWIGGSHGICRNEGLYLPCFTEKNGLLDNDVWSILEDRAGNIWIGNRNSGLSRYDGKTFVTFKVDQESAPVAR
jgi:ligand-binding sensor domain-containing protein